MDGKFPPALVPFSSLGEIIKVLVDTVAVGYCPVSSAVSIFSFLRIHHHEKTTQKEMIKTATQAIPQMIFCLFVILLNWLLSLMIDFLL